MTTTVCFVDTNVFYDYPNLDQIKWLEVVSSGHVLIVLPPVIFRELNDHKDSGRTPHLAERATSTLRNINNFFKESPSTNRVLIRDSVELFAEFRDAIVNPPLNHHINDDQLLANVLLYKNEHPDDQVFLITEDVGLQLKAPAVGVTCMSLPRKYRRQPPQDPRDKKIKLLEENLEQLKKLPEPRLEVTFANDKTELILKADWTIPRSPLLKTSGVALRSVAEATGKITHSFSSDYLLEPPHEKPPRGTMEISFVLCSTGNKLAEEVVVFIDLPEDCSNWEQPVNSFANLKSAQTSWFTFSSSKDNYIQYSGPKLVHGLIRHIGPLYVTFPDPTRIYEFKWRALAGNMREVCTGILRIVPKTMNEARTPEEIARAEEENQQLVSKMIRSKNRRTEIQPD